MVLIYLQTPMRRKLGIQFLTTLSTPLIRVAGLFGFPLCLLPFLSFHIANSVAWNTYGIRNKWVMFNVWSVRSRTTSSHLSV
ncbi:hypothetical protein Bca101_049462 [Brassica carinata]